MKGVLSALAISSVYPNPGQPRKEFDPVKLEELAMSIKEYGVLEPIVVTPRGNRFMIIAGERRYRASKIAGLTEIPASVIEADDYLVEELALLENIQREDLTLMEEARAFQNLLDRGMTKEELAAKLGIKQVWRIDERTSLLRLTPEYQQLVAVGKLTNSEAFEMSRLAPESQRVLLRKIRSGALPNYNRLRAFVNGLLAVEAQVGLDSYRDGMFELESLTEDEERAVRGFESVLRSVERFLDAVHMKHLRKTVFHSRVSIESLDLIISGLQKARKSILEGAGAKEALEDLEQAA